MFDTVDVAYKELTNVVCPDTALPHFCQFFMDIRLFHNLSIEDISKMLGMSREQVLGIEQGKIWGNIKPITLLQLENVFDLKRGCLRDYLQQSCLVK